MSCKCTTTTTQKNCPTHGLILKTEGKYLIGSFQGVPIKALDLTDIVKAAETETRLSINTETGELVFQGEDGYTDTIKLDNIFASVKLSDLSDVSESVPADGSLLIYDEQLKQYVPYAIQTGEVVAALGIDARGRPVKTSTQEQQIIAYPIGAEFGWSGDENNLPAGCVVADGRQISRTTYADAYRIMGTKYGAGNGTTTFNIPDLTGRSIVGRETGSALFGTLGQKSGATTVDSRHDHLLPFGWDQNYYYAALAAEYLPIFGSGVRNGGHFKFPTSQIGEQGYRIASSDAGGSPSLSIVQPSLTQLWIVRII